MGNGSTAKGRENRPCILGVRLTAAEKQKVFEAAAARGEEPSTFARRVLAGATAAPRSWRAEFLAMGPMDATERQARFRALLGGRPLPEAYRKVPMESRASWLDREVPIG